MMQVTDIEFKSAQHVIDEIRDMNVKGGSPFGRAAAWAYKLAADQESFTDKEVMKKRFDEISEEMLKLKPTMATIYNSKNLVYKVLDHIPNTVTIEEAQKKISALCSAIIQCSLKAVDKLGKIGSNIIQNGDTIMMHSYSSALMSVFLTAADSGKKFQVICTESRPLRESRLAVKLLQSRGISVTYITDASIWEFMPRADYIIMGADTIKWDGSVANKMGTAMISQLALSAKKSVYIASEVYKLDGRTAEGNPVVLERRTKDEIVTKGDFDTYDGIDIINQFFDLTPARNITGLITEFGLVAPAMISEYWNRLEKEILEQYGEI